MILDGLRAELDRVGHDFPAPLSDEFQIATPTSGLHRLIGDVRQFPRAEDFS